MNPFASIKVETARTYKTKVLICDSSSIQFIPNTASNDHPPEITDQATLSALRTASQIIKSSSLVVFPTETVYGLAANALSASAAASIFTTKGRPQDNPLIVHISSTSMLSSLVSPSFTMPHSYELLIRHFWPGSLTMLFPAGSGIPKVVTSGLDTVAIRMPSHPVARALIALSRLPLAAPSANTSGRPSPTRAGHVKKDLGGRVELILDGGECAVGVESTVIDGLGEDGHIRVLRPGGVTVEDMKRVLKDVATDAGEPVKVLVHQKDYVDEKAEIQPTTPGMKYRHYSPTCPVYLLMGVLDTDSCAEPTVSAETLMEEVLTNLSGDAKNPIRIGLLTLTDSALTRTLLKKTSIACAATMPARQPQTIQVEWVPQELGRVIHRDGAEGTYDMAETARRLFDGLLSLDGKGVDVIFLEGVREEREGLAVMNRARKAAGQVYWLRVGIEKTGTSASYHIDAEV